jgi:hypothetical protein
VAPEKVSFEKETYTFRYEGTPEDFVGVFKRLYGPTMNAFEAAAKGGKAEALERDLVQLFTSQNRHASSHKTEIPATYLRVSLTV